jgi:hypothetical protein
VLILVGRVPKFSEKRKHSINRLVLLDFFLLHCFFCLYNQCACKQCGGSASSDVDPDLFFHFDADPDPRQDPVPYQSEANLRPLVYGQSSAIF